MTDVGKSFLLGVVAGAMLFTIFLAHANVDPSSGYFKAEIACKLVDSSVKEHDRVGEVICTNGVTLDYRTVPASPKQ